MDLDLAKLAGVLERDLSDVAKAELVPAEEEFFEHRAGNWCPVCGRKGGSVVSALYLYPKTGAGEAGRLCMAHLDCVSFYPDQVESAKKLDSDGKPMCTECAARSGETLRDRAPKGSVCYYCVEVYREKEHEISQDEE